MKLKDLLENGGYSWMKFSATNEDDDPTPGVSQNNDPNNQNPDDEKNKSVAAQKADALNLTALPYGNYADSSGKVVAKSVKGGSELVKLTPHDDRENPDTAPSDSSGASHFKDDDFALEPSQGRDDAADWVNDKKPWNTGKNPPYDPASEKKPLKLGDLFKHGDAEQNAERNYDKDFHQSHAVGQKEIPNATDTKSVDIGTSPKMKEPPGYKVNNDPNVGLHGDTNADPSVPKNNDPLLPKGTKLFPDKSGLARAIRPDHPDYKSVDIDTPIDEPASVPKADTHYTKLAKGVLSKTNNDYDLARRSLYKALQKHPEKAQQYKQIASELQKLEKQDSDIIDNIAAQIRAKRAAKIQASREKYPQARINPNKGL